MLTYIIPSRCDKKRTEKRGMNAFDICDKNQQKQPKQQQQQEAYESHTMH